MTLGVRPEFVRLDPHGAVKGRVLMDEFLGPNRNVHLETDVGKLVMRVDADGAMRAGEDVRVGFDPAHMRVFETASGRRVAG